MPVPCQEPVATVCFVCVFLNRICFLCMVRNSVWCAFCRTSIHHAEAEACLRLRIIFSEFKPIGDVDLLSTFLSRYKLLNNWPVSILQLIYVKTIKIRL